MSSRRRGRRHLSGPTTGAGIGSATAAAAPPEEPDFDLEPMDFGDARANAAATPAPNGYSPAVAATVRAPQSQDEAPAAQSRRPGRPQRPRIQPGPVARPVATGDDEALAGLPDAEACKPKGSCTLAQMRRFIKSRPYVPVHELRRRFEIEGLEDEVSPVITDRGTYYVGLPEREAGFLAELLRAGDVGCELLLDPSSPAVVGVYAMRPVARQ